MIGFAPVADLPIAAIPQVGNGTFDGITIHAVPNQVIVRAVAPAVKAAPSQTIIIRAVKER